MSDLWALLASITDKTIKVTGVTSAFDAEATETDVMENVASCSQIQAK
jgi:hypothetical protein